MKRNFKGVWIPAEIWLNKDLTLIEKCFLVEVDSLDNKEGCFASNSYFAEFFNMSKGRASQIITALKNKKFISIKYEYKNKQITKRVLNILKGGIKYSKGGYLENAQGNNTKKNNTLLSKETKKESAKIKNIDSFKKLTTLDVTLKKYDPLSKFKPGFKASILKYWRYLEEKKGSNWGNVTTVKAQVYRFEKLIKEFTNKEIIESIEECILKGNTNFNPQWTKNRINKTKKTQQNEKTADNTKSLYKEYADYLSTGASATKDYFNNTKFTDL